MKNAYIYILSNKNRTTFYIGVTNDLEKQLVEHKTPVNPNSSTKKYNLFDLVYYEIHADMQQAIEREKQLKNWHRDWKTNLIKTTNPEMKNLAEDWFHEVSHSELVSESKQQMLKQVQHNISRLHYITQDTPNKTHVQLAEEACAAGANWVQLRLKNKTAEEWDQIACEIQTVCKKYSVTFIINDNVELVKKIGADGVHLGKQDMSTAEARKILGNGFIIGGTANTFEDVKLHVAACVNYIGLGPFRFTTTKEKLSPVLDVEGYQKIMQQCKAENINIPIVAIGGIVVGDVESIINTGIYGVAVAGAITHSADKKETLNKFLNVLNHETLNYSK